MLRGAYEAIYQGTPVIVSNWNLLREAFPEGAVLVDNSPSEIATAIRAIARDPSSFRAAAARMANHKLQRWASTRRLLTDLVRNDDLGSPVVKAIP
jgi:glycosyltransferase involved in cell wall biosynthesis